MLTSSLSLTIIPSGWRFSMPNKTIDLEVLHSDEDQLFKIIDRAIQISM